MSTTTAISEVDACKSVVNFPKAKITKLSRPRLGAAAPSVARTRAEPKYQEEAPVETTSIRNCNSSHDQTPAEVRVQESSYECADSHDDCVSVLTTPTVMNTRSRSLSPPRGTAAATTTNRGLNSVPSSVNTSPTNSRNTAEFYPNPSRPTLVRGTTSQNHAPFTAAGDVVTDSYRNLMRQKYAPPATRAPLIPKPQPIMGRSLTVGAPKPQPMIGRSLTMGAPKPQPMIGRSLTMGAPTSSPGIRRNHTTTAAPARTDATPRRSRSTPGPTKKGLKNNRVTMHKVPDWRDGPEPTQDASAATFGRSLSGDASGYHNSLAESADDSDSSSQEMEQQSSPQQSERGRQFVAKTKAPCAPLQIQKSKKNKKSKSKKSWLPSFSSKKESKRSMILKASVDTWQA